MWCISTVVEVYVCVCVWGLHCQDKGLSVSGCGVRWSFVVVECGGVAWLCVVVECGGVDW